MTFDDAEVWIKNSKREEAK